MRSFLLEGTRIRSEADFHDAIAELLGFFEGYGRNLDALHDVLNDESGLMEPLPPFEVRWKGSAASRAALGERFEAIVDVFEKSPVRLTCE